MSAGLALLMLAQAAGAAPASAQPAYGPAAPAPAKKASAPAESCIPGQRSSNPNEVVICAPKVEGYRIDPDVTEAKRLKRTGGRPTRPGPDIHPASDCSTVGPMGCRGGPVINLVDAALTALTMVDKLAKGENVGRMFVTDPHPTEYQLYLEAKAEREAREAEKATARVRAAGARAQEAAAQGL